MPTPPLIIGHRGACGYLPEHTLESFQRATDLGADAVETDVVMTRDGELICRHDCELSLTANVAEHPEFASRQTLCKIDGVETKGWFAHHFTLEEIIRLRARERFEFRDRSHDGQFQILSLQALLEWAGGTRTLSGNPPVVIIEIKHADFFESLGLKIADAVERTLRRFSLTAVTAPAFVESFEINILRQLHQRIATPLIQLLDNPRHQPADVASAGGALTYAQMMTPQGLADIATYAVAIGPWKRLILPEAIHSGGHLGAPQLGKPTSLIADAHAAGLSVHAWTFRSEPRFLAGEYGGDPHREYQQFAELGLDGVITDFPDTAIAALRRDPK